MLSLSYSLMQLKSSRSLTRKAMRSIMQKLKKEFRREKVRDGNLVPAAPGRHPCSNPSERRPGFVRFKKLLDDWAEWLKCSRKLAALLDTDKKVSITSLLSTLEEAGLSAYSGKKTQYASVRFVRMLIHCSGCSFADTEEDWEILRKMSKHVSDVVRDYGIERYEDALAMRNAMRSRSRRTKYSFSDLVIFICLLKLKKDW